MSAEAVATLLLPFEKGLIARPGPRRALFLRAELAPGIDAAWREALVVEQTWRPAWEAWRRLGVPDLAESGREHDEAAFDVALVQLTRDRQESFGLIERGWRKLAAGGALVCAGAKDEGAFAAERAFAALHPLEGHLPKHGCRVFWARKTAASLAFETALQAWHVAYMPRVLVEDAFVSRPGLFSWDRVDPGTAFLVDRLPTDIADDVADFGCGWGYLSVALLEHAPRMTALTAIDAERTAVECARANLAAVRREGGPAVSSLWADLARPLEDAPRFDWIVSNLPFHAGGRADPSIGAALIATAHGALKPRGRLLVVANRHLPYERPIAERFGAVDRIAESRSYKVLTATRR